MNRRGFLRGAVGGAAAWMGLDSRAARGALQSGPSAPRVERDELVALAVELAKIPSFTTEEAACARFVRDYLQKEGFECELQEVDPGRLQTVARLPGSGGGPSVMLNGHIDIDPIPTGVSGNPFEPEVRGGLLWGGGLGNMKGGVAAMMAGAVAVRRARAPLRGDVVLALVVGELQGGPGTVHLLKEGLRTDFAIVGEPSGAGSIRTKHGGVVQLAVHVLGRSAHIVVKERGVNAILKMGKVAEAIENLRLSGPRDPELPALPLVNVGSILGGRGRDVELRGPNNVPDFCSIYVDIRFTPGMTPDGIVADIRRRLDELVAEDPELVYEVEFPIDPKRRMLREVMLPFSIDPDTPWIQTLSRHVTEIRGVAPHVGVQLPNGYGGTDASHLLRAGIPCCVYGPSGRREGSDYYLTVAIEEMHACSQAYAATLAELCA